MREEQKIVPLNFTNWREEIEETYWTNKEGKKIYPDQMDISYIENTINFMLVRDYPRDTPILLALKKELKNRKKENLPTIKIGEVRMNTVQLNYTSLDISKATMQDLVAGLKELSISQIIAEANPNFPELAIDPKGIDRIKEEIKQRRIDIAENELLKINKQLFNLRSKEDKVQELKNRKKEIENLITLAIESKK